MLKKSISIILTVTLLMSIIIVAPFSSSAAEISSNEDNSSVSNDMSVVGTNPFGQMLSSEIEDKQAEQEENDNCIISVEMEGSTATVEYQASQDATLVVAIYSDDETQMLASGQVDVAYEEDNVQVTIDIDTMPQYFYLKAYLIDKECYRPICSVYESSLYTQEMQEFLAKSTDDFDAEKVLNLDEDKDNNFAVFNDDVEIIDQVAGINEVVSADEDSKTYTIENADNCITSLQTGDIFTYAYNDTVLIIKVKSISVDGTTATIQGDEMDLNEAFDYVKIDGSAQISEDDYDNSSTDELLIFDGFSEENEPNDENNIISNENSSFAKKDIAQVGARNPEEFSKKLSAKYTFDEQKVENKYSHGEISGKIAGSVSITIETKIKYYVTLSNFFFEFSVKNSLKFELNISLKGELSVPLATFPLKFPGVLVTLTPSFVLEGSAELQLNATLESTVGFRVTPKGVENISKSPEFKDEIKIEVILFAGVSLKPEVRVLGFVVKASVEAKLGVELKVSSSEQFITENTSDDTKRHQCHLCFQGDISGKAVLSCEVMFLNIKKLKFKGSFEWKIKICDIHYSFDYNEFGFSKCPHYEYLTTVKVIDAIDKPIKDAKVNGKKTNYQGIATFYFPNGEHQISVTSSQGNKTEKIKIENAPNAITIRTDYYGAAGNIAQISTGYHTAMALTKNGDIYSWGVMSDTDDRDWFASQNDDGDRLCIHKPIKYKPLEDSNIPKSSIKMIDRSNNNTAILLNDGSLFMCGSNYSGQIGDGTNTDAKQPVKVMDNVKYVTIYPHSMALTNDGEVYIWGSGYGNKPQKIMSSVKHISQSDAGDTCYAIKNDGDLFVWGSIFDYRKTSSSWALKKYDTPTKIMSDVKYVTGSTYNIAVIKNDDNLYLYGDNYYGQLAVGDYNSHEGFIKSKYKFKTIKADIGGRFVAIDENGSLYTWGYGENNNTLGYGYNIFRSNTPKKIADNVVSVEPYNEFTLFLTTDGRIMAYGANYYYALGIGTNEDKAEIVECLLTKSTPTTSAPKKSITCVGANGEDETESSETNTNPLVMKTMNFSNLTPSEVYNVYSVADKSEDYLISQQNLKYVNQVVADESGSISLDFIPTENVENSFEFAVPLVQTDICDMRIVESEYTYNGEEQYYMPLVLHGDDLLEIGKDYVITGQPYATDSGEYAVEIVGKGLYKGAVSKTFVINSVDINEATMSLTADCFTYDGTAKEPKINIIYNELDLEENVDFTLSYRNNINVGTAYVDVVGIGNYNGSKTLSFDIKRIQQTKTYYFVNNKNWYNVYAYTWYYKANGSAVNSKDWPGEEMTLVGTNDEGYNVYSIDVSSDMDYIIFNMGSSQEQTIDILFDDYEEYNAFTLSDYKQNNHYMVNGCNYTESPFVGHSLTLGGDIGINFYIDVPDEDVTNGNVKVNFAWNVEGTEKTYSVTLRSDDKYDLGYKASCPVPAAEMTYDVTATIIVNDVPLDNTDTYSAQKYAKVILNNENNFRDKYIAAENEKGRNGEQRYNDLVTLVQTMLDYGTKAQVVFDRDTEHPANEGTDYFNDEDNPISVDMITITEENMDMDLSAYGLRYKGSTVVYLSETSIRHYYYVDDWDSFNMIKDSITFDGLAVTYTEKDDAIYFEKKGIGAADLDTPYTLTIKDKSCKFAVNDYIRHCLESPKVSDNTKALVKATYRYNVAANAFFEV